MRAKTINEINKFERGLDPKAAMGIGGINFNQQFNDLFEKSIKSLKGKTITARIIKHWTKAGGLQMESRLSMQTIKVSKIDPPFLESFGGFNYQWKLYLDDEDGNRYSLDLDQNIYIK